MSTADNRRTQPRWAILEEVYCYLDGNKFEASSRDISGGGLFLKTRKEVPLDAKVVLYFRTGTQEEAPPVFLVGVVVRRQTSPVFGIGLQWLKALTPGPPAMLRSFLETKMKMPASAVGVEGMPEGSGARSVYLFPLGVVRSMATEEEPAQAPTEEIEAPSPPPRPAIPAFRRASPDLQVLRSDGSPMETAPQPLEEHVGKMHGPGPSGPLSRIVQKSEFLMATDLPGKAQYDGAIHKVRILGLGLKGMYITTPEPPTSLSVPVDVIFYLKSRRGAIPVKATCRPLFEDTLDDDGCALELEINHYEEAGMKGILWTYLKWLHFQALKS